MALRNILSFVLVFDLEITRAANNKLNIVVKQEGQEKKYTIKEGAMQKIVL